MRYATLADGSWNIEDVVALDAILTGFTGARRVTHIAIDSNEQPHIVYGDEAFVGYAARGRSGWSTETIVEAGELRLGQLVSFALDGEDAPHVSMFEVTRSNPLNGTIAYLTTG
ncbi:MAG: hypothetical protein OEM97_05335 [Acidimicrobiia bacterium]|nr:hypothetical protein [Acidimicrobiia bacterium]